MVAIAVGTVLGWALGLMNGKSVNLNVALALPQFAGGSLWDALTHPGFLSYFSVILPMGIFNVVGSLQNIESAEAAGDRFKTFPSLMANGIGSVVAALFGSVFPTTIYIGHPGWKRLGARSGYSALNGVFIGFLCLTGTIQAVLGLIPMGGIGILLYIGIVIVAQSFLSRRTCTCGGIGNCAGAGGLGLMMLRTGLRTAGKSLYEVG
jgi:AGZA family xanthine/uracil permease-like MFS transporter